MHPVPTSSLRTRTIAALGDVMDPNCFGGAPRQLFDECKNQGFADNAWSVDTRKLKPSRLAWNALQILKLRAPGGFQYSKAGQAAALAQIPCALWETEVISFHQNFPPPGPVIEAGGEVNFYFDATYTQLFPAYGMERCVGRRALRDAIANEREAFSAARRLVVNQSWAYRSLLADYSMDPKKCAVILPGANYPVFPGYCPLNPDGRAGRDRPFVLGFIGKDWRRKGLMFLNEIAIGLRARNWKVTIRAMGFPADELPPGTGIECLGFIDKRRQFAPFLHGCDLGCLFSKAEAAGTAVLEFLGVGLPVAGFTVNGLADLLPPEAGFRFSADTPPEGVVEALSGYLQDEEKQTKFRLAARGFAPSLGWARCVNELREYWETGELRHPFRLCADTGR